MSPKKKKPKMASSPDPKSLKRENDSEDVANKRPKSVKTKEEEIKAQRRKNFIIACEEVSCKSYFGHQARFLLVYLPSCMKSIICKHQDKNGTEIKKMPTYAEESFKIEMKNNMWNEALEVCHMCITTTQYLSTEVMKDVVEIMMNAHDDEFSEHPVQDIIDDCQLILARNFNTHPPCIFKTLRNCYNQFLTSPMDMREKTFTNRSKFESNKGIVKYCMNRLEYELSIESTDGPLVDKYENIPEEMRESVKGLHWQKEKFEIFELLTRPERIERLMAVLESIIELLQFDLALWHSRYTNNLGRHIMRSHKPLMAYVLWSDNVLYTGAVTANCRQILRIFAQLIHLQYPDRMLKIITTWINTMIQTFYICETNSNSDYPNTGKYCTVFAKDFYKIITEMPSESIIKILEQVEPTFMQNLLGLLHIQKLLSTEENCIIKILNNFLEKSHWKQYSIDNNEIKLTPKLFERPKRVKRKLNYLLKRCKLHSGNIESRDYGKWEQHPKETAVSLNHIVHTFYITLEAYLDSYNVEAVQETWNNLNDKLLEESVNINHSALLEESSYSVTENFIKKYRHILQAIKELTLLLQSLKNKNDIPDMLNIFKNVGLLELC